MKKIFKNLFHYSEILMSCLINNYSKNDSEKKVSKFLKNEIIWSWSAAS